MAKDEDVREEFEARERAETPAERIDRNWGELLQEVRVTQTGVQILGAFLLILPFQPAFERLGEDQRTWYLGVVAAAMTAIVLIHAPVVAHRLRFRRHEKDLLLEISNRLILASLLAMAVTLVGALTLVVDVVLGRTAAYVGFGATTLVVIVFWLGTPLLMRTRRRSGPYAGESAPPPRSPD